jgi:selenocysteine-specific elongation factor
MPAGVAAGTGLLEKEVEEAAAELDLENKIKRISGEGKTLLVSIDIYTRWVNEIKSLLASYHSEFPLREGYPKEELRSRRFQTINNKAFQLLLMEMEKGGFLQVMPQSVALKSFNPRPNDDLEKTILRFREIMKEAVFQPPSWADLSKSAGLSESSGTELLQYLLRTGELIRIAEELYFLKEVLLEAREKVAGYLREKGEITVGEVRDLLQTSRKYALPLLEYFDREKLTRRVGDKRLPGRAL